MLSDDQLLNLALREDAEAFAELMNRNTPTSLKLALSILRDRQDAEDEVQNSFWKAWRHLGQFQRDAKFSTWVSRIVINQCLMRLRRERKASFLHLDDGVAGGEIAAIDLPDPAPTPEAEYASRELRAIVRREIRRLPPLLRHALVLRDVEELAMEDVARRLGISVVAAKSRLMRARLELRGRLKAQSVAWRPKSVPLPRGGRNRNGGVTRWGR